MIYCNETIEKYKKTFILYAQWQWAFIFIMQKLTEGLAYRHWFCRLWGRCRNTKGPSTRVDAERPSLTPSQPLPLDQLIQKYDKSGPIFKSLWHVYAQHWMNMKSWRICCLFYTNRGRQTILVGGGRGRGKLYCSNIREGTKMFLFI